MAARTMMKPPNFLTFLQLLSRKYYKLLYWVSQATFWEQSNLGIRFVPNSVRCVQKDFDCPLCSGRGPIVFSDSLQPGRRVAVNQRPSHPWGQNLQNQRLFRNRCPLRDLSIYDAAEGEVLCYVSRFCPESGGNMSCQKPTDICQAVRSRNNFQSVMFHGFRQCVQANWQCCIKLRLDRLLPHTYQLTMRK